MKMYIIYLSICLCCPSINEAFAQKKAKDRSVNISTGIQVVKIRDFNFSPMVYKGTPYYASVGVISETPRYLDITNFSFQTGKINYGDSDIKNTSFLNGSIDWNHVRKLNIFCNENRSFYFGGVLNSSFSQYKRDYYGDNPYYLYQSSLGPAILIRNNFKLNKKQITLENQFNFSLLAYSVYPSYSSTLTDRLIKKDLNKIGPVDFIFGGKVLFIDKFQRISFASNLKYPLSNKFSMKLNYNWELINIVRTNSLSKANHTVFISLIFE